MGIGIRTLIVIILVSIFQNVPKGTFAKEVTFKILDGERIAFEYQVALIDFTGYFVVDRSHFKIDGQRPEASTFQLYLDVSRSTAGFPLATKLMHSETVLHLNKHRFISFISEKITRSNNSFNILGVLTIKEISRKIELKAVMDTNSAYNLENFTVLKFDIMADIFRSHYDAGGYSGLVGDKILLNSKITVSRTP